MDPYIEASGAWPTFHHALITACHDWLNERLPRGYLATIDERVRLVSTDEERRWSGTPDVAVAQRLAPSPRKPRAGGTVATLEPETVTLPAEYIQSREGYVQIVQFPNRELVTTLEVLSPANKNEPHRGDYLSKRRALLHGGTNLVEIDLLIRGRRLEPEDAMPADDYCAIVSRAERLPLCDVYHWSIRRPLPVIPVPLKPRDGEVPLELARIFDQTYERGKYRDLLEYDRPLPQDIRDADRSWAAEIAARTAAGA
jgi:hypothetical protein